MLDPSVGNVNNGEILQWHQATRRGISANIKSARFRIGLGCRTAHDAKTGPTQQVNEACRSVGNTATDHDGDNDYDDPFAAHVALSSNENKMSYRYWERVLLEVKVV